MKVNCLTTMVGFFAVSVGLWTPLCWADDILFQDQKGPQVGTILQEDEKTVTIRFPRDSIRSMVRDKVSASVATDTVQSTRTEHSQAADLSGKVDDLRERMDRLEALYHMLQNEHASSIPNPSAKDAVSERILSEEMGRLEGVIHWQGKAVDHGKVKIVLTNYTGFSLGTLKKMFPAPEASSGQPEMALITQTDNQGRYVYDRVPPGLYRLYWQPDENTGWVRRLREDPDFEVVSGRLTELDIPEKKK